MLDREALRRMTAALATEAGLEGSVERFESLLALDRAVFDRHHFDPGHVTASSFVAHPHQPAVALVFHRKLQAWLQPGGHVEPEDTSHETAARREVAEETGLGGLVSLGIIDLDIHTYPARDDHPTHLHFDLRWAFRAVSEELAVGDGVTAVRWVPYAEALTMEPSVARPVRRLAGSLDHRS
jgi:8-oxo-dGTP pyrophosphatase MutT (NUDIX family)